MCWGLRFWLRNFGTAWGIDVDFVDATSLDVLPQAVLPGRIRLLWIRARSRPLRGVRTLFPRVEHACRSAQQIAEVLSSHPRVREVMYHGLPRHVIAARQMTGGFGGMLSVCVRGGAEAAVAVAARVEIWKRATSLGGVESLIEHRASIEDANSPAPPDLLRLSVGLEDPGDLIADLECALAAW
jgi:cystathionine gamma-synthase